MARYPEFSMVVWELGHEQLFHAVGKAKNKIVWETKEKRPFYLEPAVVWNSEISLNVMFSVTSCPFFSKYEKMTFI